MHVRPLVFSIPSTLALPTIPLEITEHPIARQASLDWWQSVSSWAELEKQVTHVAMRPSVARNGFDSPGWMSHVSRELGVPLVEAKERDSLQIIHPIEFAALVYVTPDIGIHNVDIDFTRPSYPGLSGSALLKEVSRDARDGFKSQGSPVRKGLFFQPLTVLW